MKLTKTALKRWDAARKHKELQERIKKLNGASGNFASTLLKEMALILDTMEPEPEKPKKPKSNKPCNLFDDFL